MLLHLLQYGRSLGVKWRVIFFESGPLVESVETLGVTVHVVRPGRLRQPHRFARAVYAIARLLRDRRDDLVLGWSAKPHCYGSLAALLAGIPSMWYQLGYPVGRHLSIIDRVATWFPARAVITLSQAAQRGQSALWPYRPTPLVYPAVGLSAFDPEALPDVRTARSALDLPAERPLVVMVGRLQRWKGMDVLIRAMPAVLRGIPDATAVIVGGKHALEPEYEAELQALVQAENLEDRVLLVGHQTNVPVWMQAADVIVHASDHEPFGIVVIEAMALGKAIVAGAEGGPSEVVTSGRDGFLTPFGDTDALANRLIALLNDPGLRERVGQAARLRANDFAPGRYARSLVAVLRQFVGETPTGEEYAADDSSATRKAAPLTP